MIQRVMDMCFCVFKRLWEIVQHTCYLLIMENEEVIPIKV